MINDKIKVGQILWLKVRYQIDKIADVIHPMLVAKIYDNYIEVIAIDKTKDKLHQLYKKCNYYINSSMPKESVIYEDSYAQLNTKLTIEWSDSLLLSRKTNNTLSSAKLNDLLFSYDEYQENNPLDEERIVYMTKEEIMLLNPFLNEKVK